MVHSDIHINVLSFVSLLTKKRRNTSTEAQNSRSKCNNFNYNTQYNLMLITKLLMIQKYALNL